jgi:hypothetical protein
MHARLTPYSAAVVIKSGPKPKAVCSRPLTYGPADQPTSHPIDSRLPSRGGVGDAEALLVEQVEQHS